MSRTTFIEVPVELLPEIVELLTVAYGRLTEKIEKHRFTEDCPLRFDYAPFNDDWFCAGGERRSECYSK